MKIGFILLCLIYSARCESGSKQDISLWYKDMIKQGAFEGDLTSAQQEVKKSVEKIIKSSMKSQRLFDREKLLAYENILNLNDNRDSDDDDETELDDDDDGDDMGNNNEEVSVHDNNNNNNNDDDDNVEKENFKSQHVKGDILVKSSTTIKSKNNVSENMTNLKRMKKLLDEKQTDDKAEQIPKREEPTAEILQSNETKTMFEKKSVEKKISTRIPKGSVRHLYKTCYSNFSSRLDIFYAYEKQRNELFQREEYLDNKSMQPNWFFKILYQIQQSQMISPSPNILKMSKVFKKSKTSKSKYKIKNIKRCLRTSDCPKVCRYFFEFQMCIPGFNWIRNSSDKNRSYFVQWEAFPRKENFGINFNKESFDNDQKKLQGDTVKINEKFKDEKIKDEKIKDGKIKDGKIKDEKIKDEKIKEEKIKDGKIKDGKIKHEKIKDGKIKDGKIKDGKIKDEKIKDGKIKDGKIKDGKIKDGKIKDGKIKDEKIKDGKIKDGKIKDGKIKDEKIKDGKIRDGKKMLDKTGKNKEKFIGNKIKENSHTSDNKKQNNRMSTKTKPSFDDSQNKIEKDEKKIKEMNVNEEVNSKGKNISVEENIMETPQGKLFNQRLKTENGVDIGMVNKIIDEKSNEYLIKIQSLELAVTKLEKQLLTGQLSRSNDLLSLAQLESQILHLQTKLMKLNQTFIKLQQENQVLKHGQQKIFELRQQNERQLTSNFDVNNKIHNQNNLIKQQQKSVADLSHLIQNQSNLLSKLTHRQEQVEEENRILHQVVMNQSLYISHVLKTVHVLTNQMQEERIQESSKKFNMFPVQLIKKLESLISDRQIVKSEKTEKHVKKKGKSRNITCKKPQISVGKYFHDKPVVKQNRLKYRYFTLLSKSCLVFDNIDEQSLPNLPASSTQYKLNKNGTVNKTIARKKQETPKSPTLPQKNQSSKFKMQEPKVKETEKSTQNVRKIKDEPSVKIKKENDMKVKDGNSDGKNQQQSHNSDKVKPKVASHSKKESVEAPAGQKPTKGSETNMKNNKEEKEGNKKMNNKNFELKEPLYVDTRQSGPKDCYDLYVKGNSKNGVHKIKPIAASKSLDVFCDMKNGGWTVIQRRQGGTISFKRDWNSYKKGFGGIYGEHWLGNDNIHWLTNQGHYSLRVDLTDWEKNKVTAIYEYFMIDDEKNGYRLHVDGFSGDSGDSLSKHNLNKFSTKDVDNDLVTKQFGGSCAKRFSGAWWYYKCYASNLNGVFYRDGSVADKKFDGIAWKSWKKANYSLMKVEMKIKPKTKIKDSNK